MMNNKHKLYQNTLIILGMLILSGYLWMRFIRTRLPKDIPFDLSILRFFILLYICLIFLILIYTTLREVKMQNATFTTVISYLYKPLTTLDHTIKSNKYITSYYKQGLEFIIHKFKETDYGKVDTIYLRAYLLLFSIPRGIIVLALFIDVFWFAQLLVLYKVAYCFILILLGKYLEYSFKYAKDQYIEELQEIVQLICVLTFKADKSENRVDAEEFLNVTIFTLEHDGVTYKYTPMTSGNFRNNYAQKHLNLKELPGEEYTKITKKFYAIMKHAIPLSMHIHEYDLEKKLSWHAKYKIFLYALHLTCWSYILFVSFHTLPINDLMPLLTSWKYVTNPFI